MADEPRFHRPILIAVWPGMGQVAISAGYYLMSKLDMRLLAELASSELFDIDFVEVKGGLIKGGRLPRSRLFFWKDPAERQDVILFIGEAQPPLGKYAFCRKLIETVKNLGVQQVFTFAALATAMHPEHRSRVFAAAIDERSLTQLKTQELEILQDGQIGGLNGVLLGAAAEEGLHGACLLGEMPHIFVQLPFPRAALAVLRTFSELVGLEIDLDEMKEQVEVADQQLEQLLRQAQEAMAEAAEQEEKPFVPEPENEDGLDQEDAERIDRLFDEARQNRSKAYELKRELDRLGVFKQYEDRFLDLFKSGE